MDEEMCEEAYRTIAKAIDNVPIDVVLIAASSVALEALEQMLANDSETGDTDAIEMANHIHDELLALMADFGYQVNIGSFQ